MSPAISLHHNRVLLSFAGAALGFTGWALLEAARTQQTPLPWALLLISEILFGVAVLSLLPRTKLSQAVTAALGVAVAGGLLAWRGLTGFETLEQFLRAPQMAVGLGLLATLPLPFLAAGFQRQGGWRDYRRLFDLSWDMLLGWAAALVFSMLAWGVLLASSVLLEFVGINALFKLFSIPAFSAALTCGLIGLGLAISSELSGYFSPALILRLLRLLTPFFLVVAIVFLVAWPSQGKTSMPLAALCIWAVFLASSLISAVIAEDDENASPSPFLRASARGLALIMPVLAGVAVWALWARIAQHGLTPARVCGMTAAAIAGGYGLLYFAGAVRGQRWTASLRYANIVMALAIISLPVLWLSRVLSPEALAAWSQMARYESGRLPAKDLALDEMREDWGLAGLRAYQALEQKAQTDAALAGRFDPNAILEGDVSEDVARRALAATLPSLPAGHALLAGFAQHYPGWDMEAVARACAAKTAAGHPACLVVFADLDPARPGEEAVLLAQGSPEGVSVFGQTDKGDWTRLQDLQHAMAAKDAGSLIDTLVQDGPRISPAPFNVLEVGAGYIGANPAR